MKKVIEENGKYLLVDEDKGKEGTIKVFSSGCRIDFESGTYWYIDENDIGQWYAAKWKNRQKLFDIFDDLEFLTFEEGCILINKHFKRKSVKFKHYNVKGFGKI